MGLDLSANGSSETMYNEGDANLGMLVQLPVWGFLLVLYSNQSPKCTVLRQELKPRDRQTDRKTAASLNAPMGGDIINP